MYENWIIGGPAGTVYASSPSGWFDMNLFEEWFFQILLPHIERTRAPNATTVVAGDNLASHFTPNVIAACKEKQIPIIEEVASASDLPKSISNEILPLPQEMASTSGLSSRKAKKSHPQKNVKPAKGQKIKQKMIPLAEFAA
ncbi:hypothetical protein NQ314_006556 [Rhamnusium bicolor]|uniref:DDE-1 domain-containing protein n=1 Tax=Rhamnusium bicolor TaxID=1586634 RepID=A0AAV8Z014_9CUCU|nr:hypothetical protein NQ314_006556 [Rhamnusium bicolor]